MSRQIGFRPDINSHNGGGDKLFSHRRRRHHHRLLTFSAKPKTPLDLWSFLYYFLRQITSNCVHFSFVRAPAEFLREYLSSCKRACLREVGEPAPHPSHRYLVKRTLVLPYLDKTSVRTNTQKQKVLSKLNSPCLRKNLFNTSKKS